jgi:hypothetical protein
MGFNDDERFELRFGNKVIADDEMIVDDSGMKDPVFDLRLHPQPTPDDEEHKVYFHLPKLHAAAHR